MQMTDWIEWKGGECPVPMGMQVQVKFRSNNVSEPRSAWEFLWGHVAEDCDIIAYRLHRPEDSEAPDLVNNPPHYKQGDIECIDAIKAALTEEEFRGYCKGNAIKYSWRERYKGGDESLKKAIWYLDRITK